MVQIHLAMGSCGGREVLGLLSDTMTSSITELNDSIILSHATVDTNCEACSSYSIFALQESTGLHGPANTAIFWAKTGFPLGGAECRLEAVLLHLPLLFQVHAWG